MQDFLKLTGLAEYVEGRLYHGPKISFLFVTEVIFN